MEHGRIVTSPDGARWRVRRRWSNRPFPRPWKRWLRRDEEPSGGWGWGSGWSDPFDACDGATTSSPGSRSRSPPRSRSRCWRS
jgi:hypothetical protein